MNYKSIEDVEACDIGRISTGQDELDWMYGVSTINGQKVWGMPVGKLSTWAGEGGVGKSRLSISLCRKKVQEGSKILYLQSEVDLSTLAQWVGTSDTNDDLRNFYCSEATSLKEQTDIIKQLKPELVIVDSVNKIKEFGSGSASNIEKIIDAYREATNETGCHVIFLCQLVKDGSAKGSTALTHDPDCVFFLTNDSKGGFKVSIPKKHRYGRTGKEYRGHWKHTEKGVECVSKNRLDDDRWFDADGYRQKIEITETKDEIGFKIFSSMPDHMYGEDVFIESDIVPMGSFPNTESGIVPMGTLYSKPKLLENLPSTLETCSPAVKEAYYTLHPDQKPKKVNKVIEFVKRRWGIK